MRFYLGSSEPCWLWCDQLDEIPLFISAIRLRRYKSFKRAKRDWALDSGGFSALSKNGKWDVTPEQYAQEVRRYQKEIGRLQWAASMDFMCEEIIREATGAIDEFEEENSFEDHMDAWMRCYVFYQSERTQREHWLAGVDMFYEAMEQDTVKVHQQKTIDFYLELCSIAPDIQWTPVLQGWDLDSYCQHVHMYKMAGVDLVALPVVGVGSICRRQHTKPGIEIIQTLVSRFNLTNLHGFGFKKTGLKACAHLLQSADSLAWSYAARKRKIRLEGCTHKRCNVCRKWATMWRDDLLATLPDVAPLAPACAVQVTHSPPTPPAPIAAPLFAPVGVWFDAIAISRQIPNSPDNRGEPTHFD